MKHDETDLEQLYKEMMEECNATVAHLCRAYYPLDDYLYHDLYAEVILHLWEALPFFRQQSSLSTWACHVALNVAREHYRRQTRRPQTVSLDSLPEAFHPSTDDDSERGEMLRHLYRLIDRLPPEKREVLSLYLDRKPLREIAEILGITPSSVSTQITRIKQTLIKMHENETDES